MVTRCKTLDSYLPLKADSSSYTRAGVACRKSEEAREARQYGRMRGTKRAGKHDTAGQPR
jgi:hypothetical protein